MRILPLILILMMIITRLNCSNVHVSHSYRNNTTRNLEKKNTTGISRYKTSEYITDDPKRMIYPDSPRNPQKKVVSCSFGLCDFIDDYPLDKIEKLLETAPKLKEYFNGQTPVIQINNRDQFSDEDETLCQTSSLTKFPVKATNLRNEDKIIVNTEKYKQGIVYDICSKDGGPCKFADLFPQYVATCKQKYAVRRLMVLNEDDSNRVFDDFKVPSCCVCTIKRT